jgi:probable HAF family extracellular repeat protein
MTRSIITEITRIVAGSLLASMAMAQSPRFTVIDLGNTGPSGQPLQVTNNGLIPGMTTVSSGALHAVLWYNGRIVADLGTPGLNGQNSIAFGANVFGQAVGEAETPNPDPKTPDGTSEDFCQFAALGLPSPGNTCLPFLWQSGVMNPLPTLGGNNGGATEINTLGEVAGTAENGIPDSTCPSTGPQYYQFKPVVWRNRAVQELPTYNGDPDGLAQSINDLGQAAGGSGECTSVVSPILQVYLHPLHAVLWEGQNAINLGTLGGTGHYFGIWAENLNNFGQVIGFSDLKGDTNFHAFLWARATGMQDLGTVSGDVNSVAIGINDAGQVVGVSLDMNFNPRAFLRVGNKLMDLNELVPANSPLYLATACSINILGEIIGIAIDKSTGDVHGYLAVPNLSRNSEAPALTQMPESESTRRLQLQRFALGRR